MFFYVVWMDSVNNTWKHKLLIKQHTVQFEGTQYETDFTFQNYLFEKYCENTASKDADQQKAIRKLRIEQFQSDSNNNNNNENETSTENKNDNDSDSEIEVSNDDNGNENEIWYKLWPDYVRLHITLRKYTNIPFNTFEKLDFISFKRDENCRMPEFRLRETNEDFDNAKKLLEYFDENEYSSRKFEQYYVCLVTLCFHVSLFCGATQQ